MIRGVCANLRTWPALTSELRALGASWSREDYQPGSWPNVMAARKQGVSILPILSPGDEGKVTNPDLKGSIVFELVNEPWWKPNGWEPAEFAATYVRMATKIRKVRPAAHLLFPSEIAYGPWLADCVKAQPKIVRLIDGISFHLYVNPGNTALDFERVDRARADAKKHGVDVPFWLTEFGWSISEGYTLDQIASGYAAFFSLVKKRPWIAATFPYQLASTYQNLGDREQCLGLSYFSPTGPVRLPAWKTVQAAYGGAG